MNRRCAVFCCLAALFVLADVSQALAVWPRFRTPSASVLKPHQSQYYGFSNPPPYRWGWFGAEYHSRKIGSNGFYQGYYTQYGVWQGYH